jgi:8-oxo-dGTP pyrophosphatase MutT (NUDIX family)
MPIDRPAARVIVIDDRDRVLLLRGDMGVWFMPGGGLEPGEDHAEAAVRELWEETSLRGVALGPWVWSRQHVWRATDGREFRSIERFFVLRAQAFTPRWARAEDPERTAIEQHRWWTATEIADAIDETFAPRRLGALLPPILAGVLPDDPIDV